MKEGHVENDGKALRSQHDRECTESAWVHYRRREFENFIIYAPINIYMVYTFIHSLHLSHLCSPDTLKFLSAKLIFSLVLEEEQSREQVTKQGPSYHRFHRIWFREVMWCFGAVN